MTTKKKYKEAIERLKQWDREHPNGYAISERDEFIFPELAESDDEKVIKWLTDLLSTMQYHHCDEDMEMGNKALAWLEKQAEQKPTEEYNITGIGSKHAQGKLGEMLKKLKPISKVLEQKPAEWSEEDELNIRELERLVKQVWATAEHENDKDTIHKMSDLSFFLKTLKPQPKQEWSKDDEAIWAEISNLLWEGYKQSGSKFSWDDIRNWVNPKLKSLRPQSQWRPSKEQISVLEFVMEDIEKDSIRYAILNSVLEQLKKLREE